MKLLPAIDLYEGKAVRLYQGDYRKMTVYSNAPAAVAADFRACGAEWAHLVDLEGARDGTTPNFDTVEKIARESGLLVEVGGGIRTPDVVRRYLGAGVSRVILGTAAVTDPAFLREMVQEHGERIAVGVDVKDGLVAIRGWTQQSALACEDFCARLQALGVSTVICTDISRDGAMQGANHALYKSLHEKFTIGFIASGGVSSLADVRALRETGLWGAIVGKAYYTGAVQLREAIEVAK